VNDTVQKRSVWQLLNDRRMLICLFCGFSSGMPLFVLYQLVPAWLRDQGVSLKTIGLFALIGFPYTWKFLWSPLLDGFIPPFFGRRRGWAIITQIGLLIGLASFSLFDPQRDVQWIAVVVGVVAFFSASQDIVLDAHRREMLDDEEFGVGSSIFVNAYRLSTLVPGALALILADRMPWEQVHLVVAGFMLLGIGASIAMPEPEANAPPRTFRAAVIEPFTEFFQRDGAATALSILAFMLLYKLGDSMATSLITPFYLDVGFTKTDIGTVAKVASLWSFIAGAAVATAMLGKFGVNRSLWLAGVIQMITILGFAALSEIGVNRTALFFVVSGEYLGVGLGTCVFVTYIGHRVSQSHTATQFALLTSIGAIPRTFVNASTGFIVEGVGWTTFFLVCTVCAIPGMVMLKWVAPWNQKR